MAHGETRERVYEFIVNYKAQNDGCAPTNVEIGKALHLYNSTVDYHLRKLRHEKRIRFLPGKRGIVVIGGVWIAPKFLKSNNLPK